MRLHAAFTDYKAAAAAGEQAVSVLRMCWAAALRVCLLHKRDSKGFAAIGLNWIMRRFV